MRQATIAPSPLLLAACDFAGAVLCSGGVARSGTPAMRYAMRFERGAWRFDGDLRRAAE